MPPIQYGSALNHPLNSLAAADNNDEKIKGKNLTYLLE